MNLSLIAAASLLSSSLSHGVAQGPSAYPPRLQWWADARFGMFIHWGPISLKEAEISWSRANSNPKCPNNGPIPVAEYDNLYHHFNPTQFDARQWVRTAKAAGMKYMVLTAKHCDGFLLWDSKVSDYNIMHTPFKRDVCAELAKAAHDANIRIGWYFSPMDWKDPDCRNANNAAFVKRMQAEIKELLTNYGKIDLMWFDYDGRDVPWDQKETYALVKKLQPKIVINNRLDLGPGVDAGNPATIGPNADYCTPEQWIGGYDDRHPWESCMTISRSGQWSWGGVADGVKPTDTCLNMLTACAGGDGNVLLDVGPMPTGQIAPDQTERLHEIGKWMDQYGASIRGTRGGPFKPGEYGSSTRKGKRIYLHLRNVDDAHLKLPPLPANVVRTTVLTGGSATIAAAATGWEITLRHTPQPHPLDTIVAIDLDRSAMTLPAVDVPSEVSLALNAKVTASNTFQNNADYGPEKAVDGKETTRWATDNGIHEAWLEVDLGKPTTFNRALILQGLPELDRVHKFAIEAYVNGEWHTCYTGGSLGARLHATFPPTTAQHVRLHILDSAEGPTISEFRLFAPS